jgi:hypothetical protein
VLTRIFDEFAEAFSLKATALDDEVRNWAEYELSEVVTTVPVVGEICESGGTLKLSTDP